MLGYFPPNTRIEIPIVARAADSNEKIDRQLQFNPNETIGKIRFEGLCDPCTKGYSGCTMSANVAFACELAPALQ
jgi:hypothetical protein